MKAWLLGNRQKKKSKTNGMVIQTNRNETVQRMDIHNPTI